MRKPGDIVMIFGDPMQLKSPLGQARLHKFVWNIGPILEEWIVEYLDDEGSFYSVQVRKEEVDGTNKTQ